MAPYLPRDGASSSQFSEGGALYALGLIHANHGQDIRTFLLEALRGTQMEVRTACCSPAGRKEQLPCQPPCLAAAPAQQPLLPPRPPPPPQKQICCPAPLQLLWQLLRPASAWPELGIGSLSLSCWAKRLTAALILLGAPSQLSS